MLRRRVFRCAFSVDQRLGFVHYLLMSDRRAGVGQRFDHLCPEPGVVGCWVGEKFRRQGALAGDAGEQDAHGIRDGEAEDSELFCGLLLELVIDADVQH